MTTPENEKQNQPVQPTTGVNPIWLFAAMGVIFTAIMVFELFFKAKH